MNFNEEITLALLLLIYGGPIIIWLFRMKPFIRKHKSREALMEAQIAPWIDFMTIGETCREKGISKPLSYWSWLFFTALWLPGTYLIFLLF